jgi:hypothetical protein
MKLLSRDRLRLCRRLPAMATAKQERGAFAVRADLDRQLDAIRGFEEAGFDELGAADQLWVRSGC